MSLQNVIGLFLFDLQNAETTSSLSVARMFTARDYFQVRLSACLSVCVYVCMSVSVSISVCLPACQHICLSCLFVFLSVFLSVCLSVFLSLCLYVCLCQSLSLSVCPPASICVCRVCLPFYQPNSISCLASSTDWRSFCLQPGRTACLYVSVVPSVCQLAFLPVCVWSITKPSTQSMLDRTISRIDTNCRFFFIFSYLPFLLSGILS